VKFFHAKDFLDKFQGLHEKSGIFPADNKKNLKIF